MSPEFEVDLLAQVEDAGINASAPREQLWIDGWLVRFSPGKARRARSVQPVAPGRLPVEDRLERCLRLYARVGLQPFVRITPFSQPEGLDATLAALGMDRIGESHVMVAALAGSGTVPAMPGPPLRFEAVTATAFAEWIGRQRGSSPAERAAHADRLRHVPVPHRAVLLVDASGESLAGGQVAIEDDLAGLYDIHTAEPARGRGWSRVLCAHLLAIAGSAGARVAYLQVDASNEIARRLYRRLGFAEAYAYHYRSPPAA
jgi:ribosomal protein S18 acetylase RimI-like enzyme